MSTEPDEPHPAEPAWSERLPEWCNVYEGLTDEEIDEIERFIVRDPRTRRFPETDSD